MPPGAAQGGAPGRVALPRVQRRPGGRATGPAGHDHRPESSSQPPRGHGGPALARSPRPGVRPGSAAARAGDSGEATAGLRCARLPRRGRRPAAGGLFQSREEAARGEVPTAGVSHLLLEQGRPCLLPSPRPLPPCRRSSCSPATSAGRLGSARGGTATSLTAARPPPRQRQCRRRPRRRGVCPSPPILRRRTGRRRVIERRRPALLPQLCFPPRAATRPIERLHVRGVDAG
mmetsp:Transcript_31602/g.101040  ORF Transcript_31602/g.101040 Transcript_31602/m.101040 type:complete len:232 (-) Transcript_31602:131-826(-)